MFIVIAESYRDPVGQPGQGPSIYPYDVTVSRLENEGFGFVIISSVSRAGSTIGRIIPGTDQETKNLVCSSIFALHRISGRALRPTSGG